MADVGSHGSVVTAYKLVGIHESRGMKGLGGDISELVIILVGQLDDVKWGI
jgi:hypothetical protein